MNSNSLHSGTLSPMVRYALVAGAQNIVRALVESTERPLKDCHVSFNRRSSVDALISYYCIRFLGLLRSQGSSEQNSNDFVEYLVQAVEQEFEARGVKEIDDRMDSFCETLSRCIEMCNVDHYRANQAILRAVAEWESFEVDNVSLAFELRCLPLDSAYSPILPKVILGLDGDFKAAEKFALTVVQ